MNKLTKISTIILTTFSLLISCKTTDIKQPQKQEATLQYNFANIYNPSSTSLHPKFLAYNTDTSTTLVYNYLYLPELLFVNNNGTAQAKVEFSYKVTPSLLNYQVLDSIRKTLVIRQQRYSKSLVFPQKITNTPDSSFLITIYAKDLYKRRNFLALLHVDKQDQYSPNNFIIKYPDLKPVFSNYIYVKNPYYIEYNKRPDTLYVFRYAADTTIPLPPYYLSGRISKLYADTVYPVRTDTLFSPDTNGVYLFSTRPDVEKGKTVVALNSYYPLIHMASDMIGPLAYIANDKEYEQIKTAESPKLAVDNFWLKIAGNPSKAKDLIKIYYNRVELANIYFTDYREGWRTDRGMLYIVLGPPPIVYKSDKSEQWLYYDRRTNSYISFVFEKKNIKPLKNIYVLRGSSTYKSLWDHAISQWRKGIVP